VVAVRLDRRGLPRRFLHEYDLERLEQRFDDAGIAYLDPNRGSVA